MARNVKMLLGILFALALASGALAQNYREAATNTGYRDGMDKGTNDARQGKSFDLNRHDAYKDADRGYHDSFGNKNDYRRLYRVAFERGYREGYQREAGLRPGAGRGAGSDRNVPQGRAAGQSGRDGQRQPPPPPPPPRPQETNRLMMEAARNTGYRDGTEKGRNDAAQLKSFDPQRHDAYKDADRGYHDSFRNKTAYRDAYRQAFLEGYQAGYRLPVRRR